MPQIRSQNLNTLHQFFTSETLAWSAKDTNTSSALVRYIEQHGIAHLLYLNQFTQAEQRMLDCYFMAAYIKSWGTVVKPWTAWRILGIDKARSGFMELAQSLPNQFVEEDVVSVIAEFLRDVGLYQPGTVVAEWLLERRENILGSEHPDTLNSMNNLAGLYRLQARYAEAEPLYIRAIAVGEQVLGLEHIETLSSTGDLAGLYESLGRYAEAEPLYLRVFEVRERTLGTEHSETLISVNNLAVLYTSQGRYSEAEPLFLRAVESRERVLGSEHPDTLISVNNLAVFYKSQGRYADAEPLYLRVLDVSECTLGIEHSKTVRARYSLGFVYLKLKHLDLALLHLQKTLEGEISLFGQDSDELIMTHWNLARAYRMKDDPANASVHTLRCWEIEVKHKERLDPDVLYTAVVYLKDLIASDQRSVAREFRAMIYKEFIEFENPSQAQAKRIVQMHRLEI